MTPKKRDPFTARPANGWGLFALITLLISSGVLLTLTQIDLENPEKISEMIALSVRLAVPWLFLAFAASSLPTLFPSKLSRWVARNRRMLGLCFAAGMAWQLLFIVWLVAGHFDYYMAEAYSLYDLSEQIPGYLVLIAMTMTSFKFGRQYLTARQWRLLHKGGIYFLWAVVWSTYWFELYYYADIQPIDHVYYWMGISAWGCRSLAWGKKRGWLSTIRPTVVLFWISGIILIAFGNLWAPAVLRLLPANALGGWIELFVPFLPLIPVLTAVMLSSGSGAELPHCPTGVGPRRRGQHP